MSFTVDTRLSVSFVELGFGSLQGSRGEPHDLAAPDCAGQDHAPDAVGIGRIVGRGNLLEDTGLDLLVRGSAERFGNVEGDLARCQSLEHDGRKRCETQASLNKADSQTEAAGNLFDSRTPRHERRKGLGFVGRVHGETVVRLRGRS